MAIFNMIKNVKIKRVYEKTDKSDGFRILVDRLWPRGLTKEKAAIDLWLKEIAPSNELRKWFAHDVKKWEEFKDRYRIELSSNRELTKELKDVIKTNPVTTLVFSASDILHNNVVALKEILRI